MVIPGQKLPLTLSELKMPKFWIFLISISLPSNFCYSQDKTPSANDSWEFYEYLKKNNLNDDALTWLLGYPDSLKNDSVRNKIYFEISKLYSTQNKFSTSLIYLKKIKTLSNIADLNYALCIAFITSDTCLIRSCIKNYPNLINNNELQTVVLSLKIITRKKIRETEIENDSIDVNIAKIAKSYVGHKKKSPVLAGLMSAIIPGLGKLYMGYKYQAMSSFIMNAGLDVIILETFWKSAGIIKWIIPLPLGAIFYGGNVLGTVLLAHKREIDFQKNIDEEIKARYYNKLVYNK